MRLHYKRYFSHLEHKWLYRAYLKKICGPGQNNKTTGRGWEEVAQCNYFTNRKAKIFLRMFLTNCMKMFQCPPQQNNFILQYFWRWILLSATCKINQISLNLLHVVGNKRSCFLRLFGVKTLRRHCLKHILCNICYPAKDVEEKIVLNNSGIF